MLLRIVIRINIVRCISVNKIEITVLSARVLDALSGRGLKAKTVHEFERYGTRRIVKHCLGKGQILYSKETVQNFVWQERAKQESGTLPHYQWGITRRAAVYLDQMAEYGKIQDEPIRPWEAEHNPLFQAISCNPSNSMKVIDIICRTRDAVMQLELSDKTKTNYIYALRCTRLPGMLALFGLLCMVFALGVSESRIVDATWADGRRVGIFPGGSLPVGSAADAALGTVLSVGILAWIAVILVAVMAFHQNKTAGAARLAVAYGVSRVRYMVGSFAAETIMLQGWYMVLYFLLSVVTGSLSQPGRTAFFWMQSAWILQASYAAVWLVCRLCGSELAGATFCFVVTLAGVIVSVSAPDPAAVSPLSALLFYATPMPYWLALGGGHPIPWQAVGYGAGVTALCLAAALAITTVRDVE